MDRVAQTWNHKLRNIRLACSIYRCANPRTLATTQLSGSMKTQDFMRSGIRHIVLQEPSSVGLLSLAFENHSKQSQ